MNTINRTVKWLREKGCIAENVEKYSSYTKRRRDLFNFIDVIAVDPEYGVIGIQVCRSTDFQQHVRKLKNVVNDNLLTWLKHADVQLWGWRKVKVKRSGKAMVWRPRVADVVATEGDEILIYERKRIDLINTFARRFRSLYKIKGAGYKKYK